MADTYRQTRGILIGSGAIVVSPDGTRVLMVRHRDMEGDFWRGKWIFPGGKVEHGERLGEAAAREVLEETGLRIRLGHPIPPHDRVVRGPDGEVELHVVYHVHWAVAEGEDLTPADDVAEARWFTGQEVLAAQEDIHEDTWSLIELSGLAPELERGLRNLPDCTCMPGED